MDKIESEVQRRRARCRQSQAKFRQRQAQSIQDLKDKNCQLIESIEKLVNVTRGDEHPELLQSICNAAKVAGITSNQILQDAASTAIQNQDGGQQMGFNSIYNQKETPCSSKKIIYTYSDGQKTTISDYHIQHEAILDLSRDIRIITLA